MPLSLLLAFFAYIVIDFESILNLFEATPSCMTETMVVAYRNRNDLVVDSDQSTFLDYLMVVTTMKKGWKK